MPYNYEHFRPTDYDFMEFAGPRVGESVPDVPLRDADGDEVRLSDYRGRWVVLEVGSLTCPMYAQNVSPAAELAEEFPDAAFLLLYVREAHPGERTGPHRSFDEKLQQARRVRPLYGERRRILVDDLHGSLHRALGEFPNMVYVLDDEGSVVDRADWMSPDRVRQVLQRREPLHHCDHIHPRDIRSSPWFGLRVLLNGGWVAVRDFLRALPKLLRQHSRVAKARGVWRAHSG